ncbi:MAG: hypothetical protein ACPGVU_09590 [Limisphaerales bacterium]
MPVSGQPVFTVYARDLTERSSSTESALPVDREKLDLRTRVRTLQAMIPSCTRCSNTLVPGSGWVDLEEHLVLQSDTPSIKAVCPDCEKNLDPQEEDEDGTRIWSKELRRLYDGS